MILIYSHTISTRLQYICKFILEEQLGLKFSLTIDSEGFKKHDGPKINYSNLEIEGDNIKEQNIACFELNDYKAFFKTANSDFPFDIFAASFYLLSRYEEYLPHEIDMYGRYAHENSLAFKEDFLRLPLINIWISNFSASLKNKFTALNPQHLNFKYTPTYDIDIAWSYKSKGIL